jgi:hypothetical protein
MVKHREIGRDDAQAKGAKEPECIGGRLTAWPGN